MSTRLRSAARREEILAATVLLVCERGHQAIRIADVAKRLSVSAGLIIYHFHTKEELLAAAFEAEAERDLEIARALVADETDPVRRLVKIVDWYLPTGESSRSWRLWLDGWAASQFDDSLAGVIQGFDAAWRRLFAEALHGCVAVGSARVDRVDEAAEQLAAFVNGLAVRSFTSPERLGEARLQGWVRQYLARQFEIPELSLLE